MPTPQEFLENGKKVIESKNHDYTTDGTKDMYENFRRQAELLSWFRNPIDASFVCCIGIKLSRLAALLDNKTPRNESIVDSFQDLTNYCALWAGWRTSSKLEIVKDNRIFNLYDDISSWNLTQSEADYIKRIIQDRVKVK